MIASGPRAASSSTCGGLLERARVQLDEQVDDDLVVVVLVEAHVGEELARAELAEGGVGERVAGLGARAGLDVLGVDGDGARGDPRRAGDHPLPAVLDRLDAALAEAEVGLVVHAVQALDDGLLELVDHLGALAGLRVDLVDPLVVHLHLEVAATSIGSSAARPCSPGTHGHSRCAARVGCRHARHRAVRDRRVGRDPHAQPARAPQRDHARSSSGDLRDELVRARTTTPCA